MTINAGVWLDQKMAVIVFTGTDGQRIQLIESGVDGRVRLSGGSRTRNTPYGPQDVVHDSTRDSRHQQSLKKFFRVIIGTIETADKIILFGPGEAKLGLMKEIEKSKLVATKVVEVQKTDKMTARQIAAHVRAYFKSIGPVAE